MSTGTQQPLIPSRSIQRITSFEEQEAETYRFWQNRTTAERMTAIDELVKDAYATRGIDLNVQRSNRSVVRI